MVDEVIGFRDATKKSWVMIKSQKKKYDLLKDGFDATLEQSSESLVVDEKETIEQTVSIDNETVETGKKADR
jgi:hypothetical protein